MLLKFFPDNGSLIRETFRDPGMKSLVLKMGIYYGVILCITMSMFGFVSAQNNGLQVNNLAAQDTYTPPVTLLLPDPPKAPPPVQSPATIASATSTPPPIPAPAGRTAGNPYAAGNCTWYAKSRRPDIPSNLGNANTWVSRSRAQGIPTGTIPKVGAIGQRHMHVVYIESVNADGTVTLSEMNYSGLGVVSKRTVPANHFQYIY